MYIIRFIYILFYQAFYILLKKKKEATWAAQYLKTLEQQFDGAFDERTFKKIIFYYSLKIPAICDAFLMLHGRKTNRKECERLLHYFICSSVFDNFFDRQELSDEEIEKITFSSDEYIPLTFTERIALHSHTLLLNYVADKEKYISILKEEYNAQSASRKQFSEEITNEEIENITLSKGGNAVLLCSYYLDIPPSSQEEKCWYSLGTAIQLTNDLFDIYRDLQSGLQTLPNRMKDACDFHIYFYNKVLAIKKEMLLLNATKRIQQHFMISMMGICALGLISIEQLIEIQGNEKKLPPLKDLARKDLIIDMEKPGNLWKWIKIVYTLAKL